MNKFRKLGFIDYKGGESPQFNPACSEAPTRAPLVFSPVGLRIACCVALRKAKRVEAHRFFAHCYMFPQRICGRRIIALDRPTRKPGEDRDGRLGKTMGKACGLRLARTKPSASASPRWGVLQSQHPTRQWHRYKRSADRSDGSRHRRLSQDRGRLADRPRACLGSHRPCDPKAGPILKAMMRDGARLAPQGVVWITPESPEINLHPRPTAALGPRAAT